MSDKPLDRRRFFRKGLFELFKPLGQALAPIQKVSEELARLDGHVSPFYDTPSEPEAPVRHWLRPPGSQEEQQFREQCTRSGECVRVCPVKAIKLDYAGDQGEGTPYIDADEMSCVMCTGLHCMAACPSGALLQTMPDYIDMGIAVWQESTCLRTAGDDCTACVEACPVGGRAITIDGPVVEVRREGCTGCGHCQHQCPTTPKSIMVTPKSNR